MYSNEIKGYTPTTDDGTAVEVRGEELYVERGTHQDQREVLHLG